MHGGQSLRHRANGNAAVSAGLTAAYICAMLGAFVLLLVATTSGNSSGGVSLAEAYSDDGQVRMDFGVLGGCIHRGLPVFSSNWPWMNCRSRRVGYIAYVLLETSAPAPMIEGPPLPYNRRYYTVLGAEQTAPLVLLPIAAGAAGLTVVLFVGCQLAHSHGLDTILVMFTFISMVVAWVGFGMAYRIHLLVRAGLQTYNTNPSTVRFLNVTIHGGVWIVLASAVCVTVALFLGIYRFIVVRRRQEIKAQLREERAAKQAREAGDLELRRIDSDSTAVNP